MYHGQCNTHYGCQCYDVPSTIDSHEPLDMGEVKRIGQAIEVAVTGQQRKEEGPGECAFGVAVPYWPKSEGDVSVRGEEDWPVGGADGPRGRS
ncbi:hypothetical protein INR49_009222 [Caranx melampygus]|nr:hypothetical protein INR49_009222 [Caranx melampygus]